MTLREIEREYDPKAGDFGRGTLVSFEELNKIEPDGYELLPHIFDVPVYGTDGAPTARRWRGYVREEAGKHYIAAVEFVPAVIQWFLRLFPQFQEMLEARDAARNDLAKTLGELMRAREALQSANYEKLMLQDRLESAIEDRTRLWDLTHECISNERIAYQMQVNAEWQKHGFGAPYPEAPKLPNAFQTQGGGTEGRPQVQMPSTRVARATARFIRETIDEERNRTP